MGKAKRYELRYALDELGGTFIDGPIIQGTTYSLLAVRRHLHSTRLADQAPSVRDTETGHEAHLLDDHGNICWHGIDASGLPYTLD